MTITITINDAGGVDFDTYLADFDADFERDASDRGSFNGFFGFSGSQYTISDGTTAQGFIANGDFSYDLSVHELTGELDSLQFGNNVQTSFGIPESIYTMQDSAFTISGLDTDNGSAPTTHEVLNDLLNGNTAELETVLNSDSIEFVGGAGDDSFTSYAGDDTLTGNGGDDVWVFEAAGFGDDVITDFDGNGDDTIAFDTSLFANWSAVQAALGTNSAGDVVIASGSDSITLTDVSSVSQDDFAFV